MVDHDDMCLKRPVDPGKHWLHEKKKSLPFPQEIWPQGHTLRIASLHTVMCRWRSPDIYVLLTARVVYSQDMFSRLVM